MEKKTTGIIATVAAVLLCGCPGIFLCLFGAISAFGGGTYNLGSQSGNVSPTVGFVLMCLSVILVAIPIVVGIFTLRNKPAAAASTPPTPPSSNEPLPPAS